MIWDDVVKMADDQAADAGLWMVAETVVEAYLQQELRRLHMVIEAANETALEKALWEESLR